VAATAYSSNDVNAYAAFAAQSAIGTAGTTFTFARYLNGAGLEHARAIQIEREGGDGQDPTLAYVQQHTADPKLPVYARPEITARLIAYAFGQGTTTSAASTLPYTHEIWPVPQARLLTFEQFAPGAAMGDQVIDSKITKVTVSSEHGAPVKVDTEWMGGDTPRARAAGSARTVTTEAEAPFLHDMASVQVAVAGAYAADESVSRWQVEFTRGVDDAFGVGYGRDVLIEKTRDVTVTFTRRFQAGTDDRAVNYGSGSLGMSTIATGAFKFFVQYGQGVASAARSLEVEVPLLVWDTPRRNVLETEGGIVLEEWTGRAIKGATHLIRAQVKNALPTALASGLL